MSESADDFENQIVTALHKAYAERERRRARGDLTGAAEIEQRIESALRFLESSVARLAWVAEGEDDELEERFNVMKMFFDAHWRSRTVGSN